MGIDIVSWRICIGCFYQKHIFTSSISSSTYSTKTSKQPFSKGRDTLGDKSLRHVAGTCRRNNSPRVTRLIFMKIIVAAICRANSNQFEFVRLVAATKLAKAAKSHSVYTSGNKSLRQCINEPMRERHMVSHIELEH